MLDSKSLRQAKLEGRKLAMVTAYDYPFAQLAAQAGADLLLVGDSGANVVLGMSSTRVIGMAEMLVFVAAVRRGAPEIHLVGDLPFGADANPELALENSRRMIQAGASSVKLEGPQYQVIEALVAQGIEVVGHLGLLPQTAVSFKKVAKEAHQQEQLIAEALKLQELGICALVLEHIPEELGARVSALLDIPVIGIGAGAACDGQVMVLHDLLGLSAKIPSLAHGFGDLRTHALRALQDYVNWVRQSSDLKALRSAETENSTKIYGS